MVTCAGCDQLRAELERLRTQQRHEQSEAEQAISYSEQDLETVRTLANDLRADVTRTDGQLRSLMVAALKDADVIVNLQAALAQEQVQASAAATDALKQVTDARVALEKLRAAVRELFESYSDHERAEAEVKLRDLVPPVRYCEFCALGNHHVSECGLLRHLKGVRFDEQTRQILWSICERHDHWSTNSHTECGLCNLEAGQHGSGDGG